MIVMLVEIRLRQAQDGIVVCDIVSEFWAVTRSITKSPHCSHSQVLGRQESGAWWHPLSHQLWSALEAHDTLNFKWLPQEQCQIRNEPASTIRFSGGLLS